MTQKTQTTNKEKYNLSPEDLHLLRAYAMASSAGENNEVMKVSVSAMLNELKSGKLGSTVGEILSNDKEPFYEPSNEVFRGYLANTLTGKENEDRIKSMTQLVNGMANGDIETISRVKKFLRPQEIKDLKASGGMDFDLLDKVGEIPLSDGDKYILFGDQVSAGTRGDALRAARKEGKPFAIHNGVRYSTAMK